MIKIIKTDKFDLKNPIGSGVSGCYFILNKSKKLGIKVFYGRHFNSMSALKKSKEYKHARNELKCLKRATKYGLAPKPKQLVVIKSRLSGYSPAVIMEHISGKTLYENNHIFDCEDVSDDLFAKLKRIGIRHNDLHFNNIMIKGKRLVPVAIDFAYAKLKKIPRRAR